MVIRQQELCKGSVGDLWKTGSILGCPRRQCRLQLVDVNHVPVISGHEDNSACYRAQVEDLGSHGVGLA